MSFTTCTRRMIDLRDVSGGFVHLIQELSSNCVIYKVKWEAYPSHFSPFSKCVNAVLKNKNCFVSFHQCFVFNKTDRVIAVKKADIATMADPRKQGPIL